MLGLSGRGRFGGGDLQGEGRTVVRLGADVQGAGVDGEPVGDVGQAGAVGGGGRVVAASGVGDGDCQRGGILAGGDGGAGAGACVFGGVVERFQAAEVDGCFDLRRVAADARLCAGFEMARQSVSKHLAVLEEASLITTLWRGREKLHYLNAAPINDLADRWINDYDRDRVRALADLKKALEGTTMQKPEFVYKIYI